MRSRGAPSRSGSVTQRDHYKGRVMVDLGVNSARTVKSSLALILHQLLLFHHHTNL